MGRLAGTCTLILGICLAALPAGAAQRVALVVGNSDYKLVSPLANPANDAALMAATLREVGFEVIEAKNADRRGMARAIRDFGKRLRRAGPEAIGLFYYAGHGVQAGGTNYLIPLGAPVADEADLEIEAVSASWVLGQMESAGNALNVVILDACRNNPFKGAFRAATRGLARMNAPSGSLVAYSAAPGQVAADGTTDNSPYTAALVAAMKEPGLPLEQVFKRVRVAVETATGEQQTPWEESSLKGDFYFVPQGSTVTVTPPGAPPAFDVRALELAFWQSIEDSDNPADFGAYLTQYPQGTFAGLATLRRDALKDRTEETAAAAPPPAAATRLAAKVEAGAAEWQSASDIQEVLIGTGTVLSGFEEGTNWKERYEPDGAIEGLWGTEGYQGKWSFKGDLMCFDYEGTEDDGCWYLAIKGDKVFWWKEDGTPDGDSKVLRK